MEETALAGMRVAPSYWITDTGSNQIFLVQEVVSLD